jgi:hypothetical protein
LIRLDPQGWWIENPQTPLSFAAPPKISIPPLSTIDTINMSFGPYQNGAQTQLNDESDVEEENLVNDYREQVHYDDGMSELDRTTSVGLGSQQQDLQAQLAAAATPLEYQATLETKFASYDNYCSLFHFILNSEGPVDLEVPSVR